MARKSLIQPVGTGPIRHAQCRSLGHEWRHKGTVGNDERRPFGLGTGTVGLRSQCADCSTVRTKWVTRSGEVLTRYDYPEDYSTHGDERRTPRQWRQTFVAKLFEESEQLGVA